MWFERKGGFAKKREPAAYHEKVRMLGDFGFICTLQTGTMRRMNYENDNKSKS